MNNECKLPFCEEPISTMYNNYSFVSGIIQGNHSDSEWLWAYGRYINCMFNPGFGFHLGKTADVWKNHNDYIQIVNKKYGIIPLRRKIYHMKKLLDNGYYIMIVLDEQFIPNMAAYHKYRYLHDSLLVGYSDVKQVFSLYGRFADERMRISEVSYSDIEMAIHRGSWSFVLKYAPRFPERFNVPLIRTELSHYLYSATSSYKSKGTKYGIDSVLSLRTFLIKQYRETGYLDYKYTRGIMEHKSIMLGMCQYITKEDNSKPLNDAIQYSKSVADASAIVHMLALKAKVKSRIDHDIIKRIDSQFTQIIEAERTYIPLLLNYIHV